jgi:hypothetical protein
MHIDTKPKTKKSSLIFLRRTLTEDIDLVRVSSLLSPSLMAPDTASVRLPGPYLPRPKSSGAALQPTKPGPFALAGIAAEPFNNLVLSWRSWPDDRILNQE